MISVLSTLSIDGVVEDMLSMAIIEAGGRAAEKNENACEPWHSLHDQSTNDHQHTGGKLLNRRPFVEKYLCSYVCF